MRYFHFIIQLLAVLFLAKYASEYVLQDNYLYVVFVFAGVSSFLLSSLRLKFIIFSLMIFFPILMPKGSGLPLKTLVELMAPILCLASIPDMIKRRQPLFSREASVYFIAIGILVVLAIVHYILNPVLGRLTFGVDTQSAGLRSYFLIIAGIATFFCSYWFFKCNELNAKKSLSILLGITLVLGNLYIVSIFQYINTLNLFSLGSHDVIREGALHVGSIPLRRMHALGTCLVLTLIYNGRWSFYYIAVFINTLAFMIFGGGRSSGPMAFVVIFAYVTLINRKYLVPVLSVLLVASGIYVLVLSNVVLSEHKFGRAFKVEGGVKEQDQSRFYTFLYMYEVFKKSPIIGKGIGYEEITGQEDFFNEHPDARTNISYIKGQLLSGGHGTYMSILSVFGIGGLFWLMILLYGSLYYAYRLIKRNNESQNQDTLIALFAFLYLLTLCIGFVFGGHGGYDDMSFWFLAGTVAGLISKDRPKEVIEFSGA